MGLHLRPVALAAVLLAALPGVAAADVWYLAEGGSNGNSCTTPGNACGTLSGVINKASDDDTIQVGPGFYAEGLSTVKRLHFVGAGSGTLDDGLGATTLAGAPAGNSWGLRMRSGGSVTSMRFRGSDDLGPNTAGNGLLLAPNLAGPRSTGT